MNKRHYEHTLPNIRGSLSNTYTGNENYGLYERTIKKNVTMKAKVFKYKSDGNTVVASYMELEPYANNVYLSLSRKNEDGNEDDDCFHVVCRIENVYFSSGQYSRRFLKGEGCREEAATYCRNWIADTLQSAERGAFVNLISVRVFEALGLDTTSLVQAREEYKRIQEQKRREQKEKEAEERRVQEEQHQWLLNEQKRKFLDGERITGEMFLEITGRDSPGKHGGFGRLADQERGLEQERQPVYEQFDFDQGRLEEDRPD